MFLPEGEDPDSWIQEHGMQAWLTYTKQAKPLDTFLLETLKPEGDSLADRAKFADQVLALMDTMPPSLYKQMLRKQLAQVVDLSEESLHPSPPTSQPPQHGKRIKYFEKEATATVKSPTISRCNPAIHRATAEQ